jgi:desulfoferrodoxin (superoxide reductase-like protein)
MIKSPKFKMTAQISRRTFCKWSSALAVAGTFSGVRNRLLLALDRGANDAASREIHTPKLILPALTRNGNHVPVAIKLNHPMEQGHHIRRLQFLNESDPIPSKGVFHPSPANGELYFAFQARMHSGASELLAIAECNLHGTWAARQRITIPEGQGGCATADGKKQTGAEEEILPPVIRIPEMVRRGRLVKGATSEVQVKFKHPSTTGLSYENHKFVQVEEPFYLTSMQVFYGERLVTRYEMTSGLSDNPFLKFKLKFTEESPIRIVFTNSKGRHFSGSTAVMFS